MWDEDVVGGCFHRPYQPQLLETRNERVDRRPLPRLRTTGNRAPCRVGRLHVDIDVETCVGQINTSRGGTSNASR